MKKATLSVFMATVLFVVSIVSPFIAAVSAKETNKPTNDADNQSASSSIIHGGWFAGQELIEDNQPIDKGSNIHFKFLVDDIFNVGETDRITLHIKGSDNAHFFEPRISPTNTWGENEGQINSNEFYVTFKGDTLQEIHQHVVTATMDVMSTDGKPVTLQAFVGGNRGNIKAVQEVTILPEKLNLQKKVAELIRYASPEITFDKGYILEGVENQLFLSFKNAKNLRQVDKDFIYDYYFGERESGTKPKAFRLSFYLPPEFKEEIEDDEPIINDDLGEQPVYSSIDIHEKALKEILDGGRTKVARITPPSVVDLSKTTIEHQITVEPDKETEDQENIAIENKKTVYIHAADKDARHHVTVKLNNRVTQEGDVTMTLRATNDDSQTDKQVKLNSDNDWKQTFTDLPYMNKNNERVQYELIPEEDKEHVYDIRPRETPKESKGTNNDEKVFEETLFSVDQITRNAKKDVKVEVVLDDLTEEERKEWLALKDQSVKVKLEVTPLVIDKNNKGDRGKEYFVELNDDNKWSHVFVDVPLTNNFGYYYDSILSVEDYTPNDKFKFIMKGQMPNSEHHYIFVVPNKDGGKPEGEKPNNKEPQNTLPPMQEVEVTPHEYTSLIINGDVSKASKVVVEGESIETFTTAFNQNESNVIDLPYLVEFDKDYHLTFLDKNEKEVFSHKFFIPYKEGADTSIVTIEMKTEDSNENNNENENDGEKEEEEDGNGEEGNETEDNETEGNDKDPTPKVKPITVQVKFEGSHNLKELDILLEQNKQPYLKQTVSAANDWKTTFKDLPFYTADTIKQAIYTPAVNSDDLKDYQVTITENKDKDFVITLTNLQEIEKPETPKGLLDVNVKINFDNNIPKETQLGLSTIIQLYKGDDRYVTLGSLSAINDWEYTFNKLPKKEKDGTVINYYIKDIGLSEEEDYTVDITGDQEKGFVLDVRSTKVEDDKEEKPSTPEEDKEEQEGNTGTPEEKPTDDKEKEDNKDEDKEKDKEKDKDTNNNNAADKDEEDKLLKKTRTLSFSVDFDKYSLLRSLPVEVLADGKVIETHTLSDKNDWKLSLKKMPVYNKDTKKEIDYSVRVPKDAINLDMYNVKTTEKDGKFVLQVSLNAQEEELLGTNTTCDDFSIYVTGIGDDEEEKEIKLFERDGKTLIAKGKLDELYSFTVDHPLVIGEAYIVQLTHKGKTKETIMQFTTDLCGYSVSFSDEESTVEIVDEKGKNEADENDSATNNSEEGTSNAPTIEGGEEGAMNDNDIQVNETTGANNAPTSASTGQVNNQSPQQGEQSNDFLLDEAPENMSLEEKHGGKKLFGKTLPQMNTTQTLIPLTIGAILLGGAIAYRLASRKEKEMMNK